jgi:ubiquinone/menaquinone biosynthesis C-methylase UbiE
MLRATRLAEIVQAVVRAQAASVPPPRALPYLGLEHASGTGFHLLEALGARGIFRKYERVLDLDAGLGGTSRWLAARLGCEVVATATPDEAEESATLTRQARRSSEVRVVAARATTLPFAPASFTHVWIVEALPRLADPATALGEAYRVLRRGGMLALQDLVTSDASQTDLGIPGWRFASAAVRREALRRAGFVNLELRDRTAEAGQRSARVIAARERLGRALAEAGPELEAVALARESLAHAIGGKLRVVQILGARP